MASATGTFTAVDQASSQIVLRQGETISAYLSGTWVGTVVLQKQLGTSGWENKQSYASSPSGGDFAAEPGVYRLFCTRYVSGTITYSISSPGIISATTGSSARAETYGASPDATAAVNTAAINTALALTGTVTLTTPGTYTLAKSSTVTRASGLAYDRCLVIPSNTRFVLGAGVNMQAVAGLVNAVMIQNSDISGGNVNIALEGPGAWDGNSANVTRTDGAADFACISIWLEKIVGLQLRNVSLINPRAWGIGVAACSRVVADNTLFFYTAAVTSNQGGFQFQGANSDVTVRNTMGNTYDDLVAFVSHDYGIYTAAMAGPGAVSDIVIEGVLSDTTAGCLHHVRLLDSTSYPMNRVHVRNLTGPYTDGAVTLSAATGNTPYMDAINIDGVHSYPLVGSAAGQATVQIAGGANSVKISNLHRRWVTGAETNGRRRAVGVTGGGTIAHLQINNIVCLDEVAAGANISFIDIASTCTVSALIVNGVDAQAALSTGSNTLLTVSAGGTLGRALISNVEGVRISKLHNILGTVSQGIWYSNVYSFANQAVAFAQSGASTLPILGLHNVRLDGTQGGSSGCISFNGLTGTCLIQAAGSSFNNGANANVVRAGSESIRVQSMDLPVPNTVLTAALGDCFLDSLNSNAPYRCSTAPSTFTAL